MAHFYHKHKSTKSAKLKLIDEVSYIVVFAGIVMTIPQVIDVWVHGKEGGVSLVTWGSYSILTVFWIYYGIVHKEKPIIIGNVLGLIMNIAVVLGIVMMR